MTPNRNPETEAVRLWLLNDEGLYDSVQEAARKAKGYADFADHPNVVSGIWAPEDAVAFEMADSLREIVDDAIRSQTEHLKAGIALDLLNVARNGVDWDDLAKCFLDE